MADAPSQRDLFLAGREEAILLPTRFDRAIIDTVGSDVNTILQVAAAMGEEVVRYLQVGLNDSALSTARGEALNRWIFDRYQLVRQQATNARVTLQLSRTNTSPGVTIPRGSTFGTETGERYLTSLDVAFADGAVGPLEVFATAEETGVAGNVEARTITQVVSPLPDPTVSVTNPEPAAGGGPEESDDAFRERARQFFVTARRATREAIEFGATSVPGVAQALATENLEPTTGLPGYRVLLNIADSAGQANTALADEVERAEDDFRALGVPVLVVPAIPQYIEVIANGLAFTAGANTNEVLQEATNRVLAAVNGIPPGETLRRSDVIRALTETPQLIVPDGSLVEPAGDIIPITGTVIRTTRDRVQLGG